MILVMNKKTGVGSTTISYNLSKLFDIPLYVYQSSYLFNNQDIGTYTDLRIIDNVKKRQLGVYDLGSRYKSDTINNRRMSNLCKYADVAVIPFEMGFDSIDKTIETMTDIRKWNRRLKIVLILNRLDNDDSIKDFLVKNDFMEYFKEKLDTVYPKPNQKLITFSFTGNEAHHDSNEKSPKLPRFENDNNIKLTYLRNSYALCGIPHYSYDMGIGEYFLDLFKYNKKLYKYIEIDDNLVQYDFDDTKESYEQASKRLNLFEMDFKFFRYLFFLSIQDGKTKNEKEYYQDKDFVTFRNVALDALRNESFNKKYHFKDERFKNFNKNHVAYNAYGKLIKDLGFIIYEITTSVNKYGTHRPFFDFENFVYPENIQRKALENNQ